MNNISLASIVGQVLGDITYEDEQANFVIRNTECGLRVQASRRLLPDDFENGSQVYITGSLKSYVHQRCRSNHMMLEAISVEHCN